MTSWLWGCVQTFLMAAIGAALVAAGILLLLWMSWAVPRLREVGMKRARRLPQRPS
ncbi:MAG TPA: hypothetical protein VFA23_16730 [Dongiaceae bacterium]|nr:hypothetical protein [Dongiaceae bacterium]